ncbi:MAG: hypothetical protein IMZ53_02245 [Thermoplasmata archaeon]|nr:hypothetical protein [Thermoplasmata archaeon]
MDSIRVKPYKNDPRSYFSYLGRASIKAIDFQGIESASLALLDIVFVSNLDDGFPAELHFRLETPFKEIKGFVEKLNQAIASPRAHPNRDDLFNKAVTGSTPREDCEELLKKFMK